MAGVSPIKAGEGAASPHPSVPSLKRTRTQKFAVTSVVSGAMAKGVRKGNRKGVQPTSTIVSTQNPPLGSSQSKPDLQAKVINHRSDFNIPNFWLYPCNGAPLCNFVVLMAKRIWNFNNLLTSKRQ
jgi:hypothetical protein